MEKREMCKLIKNDLGRMTLATPDGKEIPCVLRDSLEIFEDEYLIRAGYKRVKIEVLIKEDERNK